ncbi:MAG: 4'-phosphopantetheinyl transferase superfamily protein [Rhodothermales bacterium]|nr:4'-phosphopantetheinyl transferase superfamily protein [Rhodothermales bacterium]
MRLSPRTIHIWTGRFSSLISQGAYCTSTLSSDEIDRASKFVFERDREKFVAGRYILRTLLASYLGENPESVQFDYNEFGKPVLSGIARFIFNVSHAEDLLCIAIAHADPGLQMPRIGVDVEFIDRDIPFSDVAESHFSPEEVHVLRQYEDKRRPFFRCWTRKEAYIKAHGEGVSYGLDVFGVSLAEEDRSAVEFDRTNDRRDWLIYSWEEYDSYFGALAVDGSRDNIEHRKLEEQVHLLVS